MVLCKKRAYIRMIMDKKIILQVILFMWRMNLNIWTWLAMSVSRRQTLTTMARMLRLTKFQNRRKVGRFLCILKMNL